MNGEHAWASLARAAQALGRAQGDEARWSEISRLANAVLGYRLLTGLVYLQELRLMRRIFSTDARVSPPGGFKATGKGPWSARVLDQGLPYIGSDENDLRTVFSEAEWLIGHGLHSVLNLPIWFDGQVIGSLNLLHHRHAYDGTDERLIQSVSGLCTSAFLQEKERALAAAESLDRSGLQSV